MYFVISESPVQCCYLTNRYSVHILIKCVSYHVFLQDVAALESQPLLGFELKVDSSHKLEFKLYHKNTLHYIFKADDIQTEQRCGTKMVGTYCCI